MPTTDIRIVLTSPLFASNERLQRAGSDHRHHVTLRDEGDHVNRLQMFLVWYFNLAGAAENPFDDIEAQFLEQFQTECLGGLYGPRTYDMVQSFKESHGLVDRSRQVRADGIVGVLTVRMMDRLARGFGASQISTDGRQAAARCVSPDLMPIAAAGPSVGSRMLDLRN